MNMSPRDLLWKGRSNLAIALVTLCAALCALGCGGWAQVHVPEQAASSPGEVGLASWYGYPYHGRKAANGTIYDMQQFTAAHRTLRFGTLVRVHNLENGKVTDVEITDRGPFVDGRIIDLSHAAARTLGMQRPGTARVRLEVLSIPVATSDDKYAVQVGAFRIRANAERLRNEMEQRYGFAAILRTRANPVLWRVVAGKFRNSEAARTLAHQIRSEENDRLGPAFVQRLDD
jgi:rare lipoprotein A